MATGLAMNPERSLLYAAADGMIWDRHRRDRHAGREPATAARMPSLVEQVAPGSWLKISEQAEGFVVLKPDHSFIKVFSPALTA